MALRLPGLSLLLILAVQPGFGQIDLTPRKAPSTFSVETGVVNVLVSARDRNGAFIPGLTRDQFELRQDGKRVPLSYFSAQADTPITVAILIDVSGSVMSILDIEKRAAAQFLDNLLRPSDHALLVGFSYAIGVWQDLTDSKPELKAALDDVSPLGLPRAEARNGSAGTVLYDAIDLVSQRKLRSVSGRKAVIAITDGVDNGSLINLSKATNSAQDADAVVYGVYYSAESLDHGPHGSGYSVLSHLSAATGGRALAVGRGITLAAVLDQIADEMRHQYLLGFTPPAGSLDGKFHKLEVKCGKSGVQIRARQGYFAQRQP